MFSGPVGPVAVFFTSLKLFFEMYTGLGSAVRPLQFNYLSYKLFLEKKSCQTPKKKEKKVIFGVLRTKVVLKFSVRLQKKKKKCKF